MSLGASKGNDALKAAVEAMAKGGVALIAAAGNSGSAVGFPAAYPGAIAVAAMDSNDKIASFSSRGPQVAVAAPGVDVKSTYMQGGYSTLSGTSMATPHVSGLAALAIAAKGISGEASVRAALRAAANPLAGASANEQGAGVPDAAKLVR
jgi:subtilisin